VKQIRSNNFKPRDITLNDDACHLKEGLGRVETWYYDAIFKNNYSIVSLINIVHIGRFGLILTGLFIYKDTKPIHIIRNRYPLSDFKCNEVEPLIKIRYKELLKGYITNENEWITTLFRDENNVKIELDFIKKSKGFKGKTYLGKWLVIPKMEVNGSIYIKDKKIDVNGSGYHDHNIYPIYAPFRNKGYYFGKLDIDNNNHLTWARVIKNRKNEQLLAILSKEEEYLNIPQKSINYKIIKQVKDHKKIMPTACKLHINNDIIKLKLKIETINYHYIGILAANYWRYHVRYTGDIEIESIKKKIDTVEITEYLKFF
jgi:hypothetical protein